MYIYGPGSNEDHIEWNVKISTSKVAEQVRIR